MKITIESTTRIVNASGIDCRVWEGETEQGVKVQCLIALVAAHKDADLRQFEAELQEQRTPSFEPPAFPLRLIL